MTSNEAFRRTLALICFLAVAALSVIVVSPLHAHDKASPDFCGYCQLQHIAVEQAADAVSLEVQLGVTRLPVQLPGLKPDQPEAVFTFGRSPPIAAQAV